MIFSKPKSFSKGLLLSSLLILPCSCAYITATSTRKQVPFSDIMALFQSRFFHLLFSFWALVECLFYIYFILTRKRLQRITKPEKMLTKSERTALFWNCVKTIKNFPSWCEGWFYYKKDYTHPTFDKICRGNMAQWLSWAFWHEHVEIIQQNQAWAEEIDWMIRTTEAHFNSTLPNGLNTELECIRLNLDPVHAIHRPLVVYISVYLATQLFNLVFLKWCWGFTSNDSISGLWGGPLQYIDSLLNNTCSDGINKITYWYRKPSTQTSKTPIVFIHGIGAGVICYAEWIYQLLCHFDRPVFLVELPYVAMHMVDAAPTAAETADEITRMLHTFGHTKAVYVSHSLGTAVTSWIMKLASNTVAGTVMIDPICFLLHYHHVAFNFVHRLPKRLMEYLLHYGASREMYISYYISRHFQWFESIYFVDQTQKVPLQNIAVFLSEKDGIVGSDQVYQYLLENDVNTYSMKGLEHAMFLINKKWKSTIIHQIDTISCKADSLK